MDQDTLNFLDELSRDVPGADANHQVVPSGQRKCPICQEIMVVDTEYGLSIDMCEKHGIWLDRGELPAIASRIRSGERIDRSRAVRQARRSGKMSGTIFGAWSLFFD